MNKIELARLEQVGRGSTLKIAASNATAKSKAAADYVCDGVADDVEINAAIQELDGIGGCVELSEGTFVLGDTISIVANNIWLRGQGYSTVVDGSGVLNVMAISAAAPVPFVKISALSITGGTTGLVIPAAGTAHASFCKFYNNSGSAIRNLGTATITSCAFVNNGGYGVFCQSGSENGIITNNRFINNARGSFNDGGTNNIFENNAEVV